jgi:hypothetical protein
MRPESRRGENEDGCMRTKNVVFLGCVACFALGAYVFLEGIVETWIIPLRLAAAGAPGVQVMLPRLLTGFAVLGASGAILCALVESAVPLKWCLGLGSIYGIGYVLLAGAAPIVLPRVHQSIGGVLISLVVGFGMLTAPIIGGFLVKHRYLR